MRRSLSVRFALLSVVLVGCAESGLRNHGEVSGISQDSTQGDVDNYHGCKTLQPGTSINIHFSFSGRELYYDDPFASFDGDFETSAFWEFRGDLDQNVLFEIGYSASDEYLAGPLGVEVSIPYDALTTGSIVFYAETADGDFIEQEMTLLDIGESISGDYRRFFAVIGERQIYREHGITIYPGKLGPDHILIHEFCTEAG